jgi:GH24 family phage-related lysozyme (muramidase)
MGGLVQSIATAEAYEPPPRCVTLTRYFYPPAERPAMELQAQLQAAETVVDHAIVRPLQTHQREALLCLVSDLLAGLASCPSVPFEKSFLVSALNKGMFQIAAAEFHVFCYAEGKVQTRLWEKRKAEQYLFARGHLLFE